MKLTLLGAATWLCTSQGHRSFTSVVGSSRRMAIQAVDSSSVGGGGGGGGGGESGGKGPPHVEYLSSALLLQGQVMQGYGRGSKKLGVPTANLPHFDSQLSAGKYRRGVYFGWGGIEQTGAVLPCVANIGVSPTFAGQENAINIVEAHFLDYSEGGDFYGKDVRLCLVGFLRPEQKFASLAALVAQITSDIELTRALCAPPLEGTALTARRIAEKFMDWTPSSHVVETLGGGGERTALWGEAPLISQSPPPGATVSDVQGWTPGWTVKRP